MKTKLIYLFAILCSAGAFTACSNNNDGDDPQPDVPILLKGENIYSGDKLALTYSDAVMPGKQIKFATTDGKTGALTMNGVLDLSFLSKSDNTSASFVPGVIPGEATTIINVELKQNGSKYTFSGTDRNDNRSVEYTGEVDSTKLTLSLKVVMNGATDLLGTWNLKQYVAQQSLPIYAEWVSTKDFNIALSSVGEQAVKPKELVSYILLLPFVTGNNPYQLLNAVLKDVTFKPDGNIIASYSKGENINNPQWLNSPANIAQYYVKDGTIYLLLNPSMLMSAFTKAGTTTPMDEVLANLMTNILPMLGTGFPLTYKINGNDLTVYSGTELTMKLINTVSPLLKDQELVAGIIQKMQQNQQLAPYVPMFQSILEQLPEVLATTLQFEVGINLSK